MGCVLEDDHVHVVRAGAGSMNKPPGMAWSCYRSRDKSLRYEGDPLSNGVKKGRLKVLIRTHLCHSQRLDSVPEPAFRSGPQGSDPDISLVGPVT